MPEMNSCTFLPHSVGSVVGVRRYEEKASEVAENVYKDKNVHEAKTQSTQILASDRKPSLIH